MHSPAFERAARDGALVLGGAAAILLQIADPVVARGVAERSAFAEDPMRRLRHTLTFVYAVSVGDERQRRLAADFVDHAHADVPGAFDPDRQLWVAATLAQVGHEVQQRLFGAVPPELDAETLAAGAAIGEALQMPPERWPADRAAFDAYWRDAVAALDVGDDARTVARDLLRPRRIPWWGRIAMPLVRAITPTLLPASVARAYGLPSGRGRVAWSVLRVVVRVTPWRWRSIPSRRLLARL